MVEPSATAKQNYSALTARAVAAVASVASAHGVKVDAPRVLADAYSVRVHLHPAPIHQSVDRLQPLHVDANNSNLISTAAGWLWNDFEDTCKGHIAWDLINLDDAARAAYPNTPDPAVLEPYIAAMKLVITRVRRDEGLAQIQLLRKSYA
jgi:hypothetical protein